MAKTTGQVSTPSPHRHDTYVGVSVKAKYGGVLKIVAANFLVAGTALGLLTQIPTVWPACMLKANSRPVFPLLLLESEKSRQVNQKSDGQSAESAPNAAKYNAI